tara:strand:+ start:49 stop:3279 length:3231 start_codon:yes stop_codon:yes gene_type:complete
MRLQILFLILLIFNSSNLFTQTESSLKFGGKLPIENFDNQFLNRPKSVWSILRSSSNNKLLIGTYEGISEFDGQNLKSIEIKGEIENQINPSFTRTIIEDEKGQVYVAGGGFFGRIFDNAYGNSEYSSLMNKLPDSINPYNQFYWGGLSNKSEVYLYTRESIIRWNGNEFDKNWVFNKNSKNKNEGEIQTLIGVNERIFTKVWGKGLYELIDNEFQFIEGSELYSTNRVESMIEINEEDIAILSSSTEINILKKDGAIINGDFRELSKWLIDNKIYNVSRQSKLSNENIPIISFDSGILLVDKNLSIIGQIDQKDGLLSNTITSIFIDSQDDIYLTNLLSAAKINANSAYSVYDKDDGIKGLVRKINKINNQLFFNTTEDLYFIDSNKDKSLEFKVNNLKFNDLPKNFIEFNNSIVAINSKKMIEINSNFQTKTISNLGSYQCPSQSLLDKNLLIVSDPTQGLLFYEKLKNNFSLKYKRRVRGDLGVIGFRELSPGILYVETSGDEGSFIISYDSFGNFNEKRLFIPKIKEIISNNNYDNNLINSELNEISLEPFYLYILPTENEYIIFNDDLEIFGFDQNFELFSLNQNFESIFNQDIIEFVWLEIITGRRPLTIVSSKTGHNWFLTQNGIVETAFSKENGFKIIKTHSYGLIDKDELSGSFFIENTSQGEKIWLGSIDSKIIQYNPEKYMNEKRINPLPIIDNVIVDGKQIFKNFSSFSFNESRNVRFRFSYPNFDKFNKNKFRYRLIGLNEDWSEWTSSNESVFTNLFEGEYSFQLQSLNAEGIISEISEFYFDIRTPWYRTILSYIIYAAIAVILILFFGRYQANRSRIQAENNRRISDLEEAKKIQESMLPKIIPEFAGYDIAAGLITSTEVGGDYYDFFQSNKNELFAVCGDATGHGTAAGMMVSIIKSGLNGLPILSVNVILEKLNNIVKKIDLGRLRMSLSVLKLTKEKIEYSAAAMPPFFYYNTKKGTCQEILLEGLPLGGLKNESYTKQSLKMSTGDTIMVVSDGLPEAENENKELYDYQRINSILKTSNEFSAEEIKKKLFNSLDKWLKGGIPQDDVTVLIIKKN